ncbi:MAG TPA: PadR family transcriptional regulator [Actinomycetota bacterium]
MLTLLTEAPMHGYQIITELADRTHGVWRPSPGSIYPLLQQLADEGLVVSAEQGGRNVFNLTDEGRSIATDETDGPPIWDRVAGEGTAVDLREAVDTVASAARQVARTGTTEQATKAAEILTEARKRLYQLLAE